MGAVYVAEDTRLGRQVALKTMRPDLAAKPSAKERFLREARLAAALEHDHICPIYQVGEVDGIPYLAMPFLKGQSLEELIKRKQKLAPAQVIRLGIQIAAGLAAAHAKGLIHRDIKPGNLWVEPTARGRVKILDFGLARSTETDTGLTQSGTILGTPGYMPPGPGQGREGRWPRRPVQPGGRSNRDYSRRRGLLVKGHFAETVVRSGRTEVSKSDREVAVPLGRLTSRKRRPCQRWAFGACGG
jgi:serine/threonine protein kinase